MLLEGYRCRKLCLVNFQMYLPFDLVLFLLICFFKSSSEIDENKLGLKLYFLTRKQMAGGCGQGKNTKRYLQNFKVFLKNS